ncbi:MAG: sigma-70 family RNA polymerase sigma factor [Algicola sp.]|nr:sigma-70 family RNA polymerase sigma factor [Algicola sp.]
MKEKLNSDTVDIELQFKENYELLLIASYTILKDKNIAGDIVQDFFEYYINKKETIALKVSFQAYAIRAVKNMSYTFLKKTSQEKALLQNLPQETQVINHPSMEIEQPEYNLSRLMNSLPPKRKEIFEASVINGHSYAEIAKANGISVNTVKTQIKRAYAFMRATVKTYLF